MRGKRSLEPPRRNMLDLRQFGRAPQRHKQGGRITAVPGAGVKSADDRLDRRDRAAGCLHVPDQPRGDEGLAYVGPGRGDEERCHCTGVAQVVAALRTCERTSSASRSISSSGCCAVKVRRRRAVPAGTVGGLMATTRKPSSASILDASSAVPASPSTTGTIGLAGSGSPARRAKALAFARGSAAYPGSRSITSSAASAAAAIAGGSAV